MATPLAFVLAVAVLVPVPANVPLAPLAGAVNVTVIPDKRFPALSLTVACSAGEYAVRICAD